MCVIAAHRSTAAVDRLSVGHGVLGRPSGSHVFTCSEPTATAVRRWSDHDTVAAAIIAVNRHCGVHVRQFSRRTDIPMVAGRRTVACHVPGRGRHGARIVRVCSHVRRVFGVPLFYRGRCRRRWRFDDRRVHRLRRRLNGHGRLRTRPTTGNPGKTMRRERTAI